MPKVFAPGIISTEDSIEFSCTFLDRGGPFAGKPKSVRRAAFGYLKGLGMNGENHSFSAPA